ncbi:hypothetical protein C0216_30730 (plasmid) [Streptomyces globosus]|uniref:Uncharacterized protein n=1 Tax=Streptomyces globosus TaxID=68209 RepID=A0A344UAG8_9ACTN|nr:hypothetical protein [Streptomyces globosus]AXE27889.1 hypothetical protein C0216_30730 [Streptomyces globosus]
MENTQMGTQNTADQSARCPIAWMHPDDILSPTDPAVRLTTGEAQVVEEALADYAAQELRMCQENMIFRLEELHPIPVHPAEREEWARNLPTAPKDLRSTYAHLELERAAAAALHKALTRRDWAGLLVRYTTETGTRDKIKYPSSGIKAGESVQHIRDAWDKRVADLRTERARRLGCTCV